MDEFDHPASRVRDKIGLVTVLTFLFAVTLSMVTGLLSLSELAQIGPGVGEIIYFDPGNGPRYWQQPGILARYAPARDRAAGTPRQNCILTPSVMAANGGSLVIEAKEMSRPPVFWVHWSGERTDLGTGDCGRSADLTLPLDQLRALANIAGGFGVDRKFGLY